MTEEREHHEHHAERHASKEHAVERTEQTVERAEQTKVLAVAIVFAALLVSVVVWVTSNGINSAIAELKEISLRNADAIAKLNQSMGRLQQAAGSPPPTAPTLPEGVSLVEGGTSCSGGGKPIVWFFHDPYCPACVASEQYLNAFIDKFGDVTNVSYKLVITYSGSLARRFGEDQALAAHKYFLCAQEQGLDKLQEFKKVFYENLKDDGSAYIPLNETQLADLARQTSLDQGKLATCLTKARAQIDKDVQTALEYGGGTYSTPTMVIDCRYTGHSGYAATALCYAFPNSRGCEEVET